MKNSHAISSASRQLARTAEQMEFLSAEIHDAESGDENITDTLTGILIDELEHVQVLTLKLTDLVAEASNADDVEGSAFASGDLESEKKPETDGPARKELA